MSFEVQTEFGSLDPEAKRALVAMQHAIRRSLDDQDARTRRRPKRQVTEVVETGGVLAKPGQVVRVRPGDTDVQVILPKPDAGNGGEDIIVSFEGDGTATGKVLVTPANSTCASPGTTTLNTPGTYSFTSTGAPGEDPDTQGSTWSGPAPLSLDDLPEVGAGKVLGNNTGSPATPVELTGSQVLDLVGSTRGSLLERGASDWAAITPGTTELPLVSKGAGADPVYQQLATAGIQDEAVTNAKLANMAQATIKLRASGAGTGDPTDGTITQALDMVGSTRGSLLERGASSWNAITPGTTEFPLCSKGAGADPVYQRLPNAGMAQMASPRLKGRTTASTGDPEDLTLASGASINWNTATGGSVSADYVGSTSNVNTTPTSGDLNVVDISSLKCGGVLSYQSVSESNIDGFSVPSNDGFWFVLHVRDSTTSSFITLIENNGNTTTSIRTPNLRDWRLTKNDSVLLIYSNSRWRVVAGRDRLFCGNVTAASWTSQQDDFVRDSRGDAVIRITLTGDQTLTGVVPDGVTPNGEILFIDNADSSDTLTIAHDSTSTAANRFVCPNNVDLKLGPRQGSIWRYDSTTVRWRCQGIATRADAITASYASASSVTNSTTPITLASLTIPANSVSAGACFEFFGAVNWTRTGTTASSVKLSLKINGTTVAFYQTATATSGSIPGDASIHGFFNFLAVGASGSVKGRLAESEFAPFGSTSATNFITASSLDTTSDITVAVTAEMTVATTQLTINGNSGLVQKRASSGAVW